MTSGEPADRRPAIEPSTITGDPHIEIAAIDRLTACSRRRSGTGEELPAPAILYQVRTCRVFEEGPDGLTSTAPINASSADLVAEVEALGRSLEPRPRADRRNHLWSARGGRASLDHPVVRRTRALDRRPRARQDPARRDLGHDPRPRRKAHPMHARPDAGRYSRLRGPRRKRDRDGDRFGSSRARSFASC